MRTIANLKTLGFIATLLFGMGVHGEGLCFRWSTEVSQAEAYTLGEAKAAGVFHPNCVHRLAFVMPEDYPPHIRQKLGDRVGEPFAFGTTEDILEDDGQTPQERKQHIKQVERAAKKTAKKETKEIKKEEKDTGKEKQEKPKQATLKELKAQAEEIKSTDGKSNYKEVVERATTKGYDNDTANATFDLGEVPEHIVNETKDTTGIDVSGYHAIVKGRNIRHAYHQHGKKHQQNAKVKGEDDPKQTPLRPSDYFSIADDIKNDTATVTNGTKHWRLNEDTVRVIVDNQKGNRISVWSINTNNKKLNFTTMWRKKNTGKGRNE